MQDAIDLEAIEAAIMSVAPKDVAPLPDPANLVDPPMIAPEKPQAELMSFDEYRAAWAMTHHFAEVPLRAPGLGAQAMTPQGEEAAKAIYELAQDHAPWLIQKSNGLIGKLMAIGMHAYACMQIVAASRAQEPEKINAEEPQEDAA